MPTGYTAIIDDDPKMTARQWIMEGLARAFGICVMMRDDPRDLTEEQILQRLTEDSSASWNEKELNKAVEESKRLATRTTKGWKVAWQKEENKKRNANKRSVEEANKMRKRHEQICGDLLKVLASDKAHEVTKNIAKFGVEQLDLVASDCLPFIQKPIALKDFMKDCIQKNARNIAYHTEELAKAKQRTEERVNLYKRLKEDVAFLEREA